MILADTYVWIDHFRNNNASLRALLEQDLVFTHPFVTGELACGNLTKRNQIMHDLKRLPTAITATHDEVLDLLDRRKLWSQGIGWIEAHLLASALLSHCRLWSLDERLNRCATSARVALYQPEA